MIPDLNIRYFPRKLVPFALEAGWAIHPESRPGDWAVIMEYVGKAAVPVEVRRLCAYAGAEA